MTASGSANFEERVGDRDDAKPAADSSVRAGQARCRR